MPEFFGLGLPAWIVIIFVLLTNPASTKFFNKILVQMGLATAKRQEGELEAERWMRQRSDWTADKSFDILEATIKDYQTTIQKRDDVLINLATTIQRNTQIVAQQTDMIRILAQNAAKIDDRLDGLQSHITRRLRIDDDW